MSKGPGYTVNDLAFYGGLIAGTSGTHVVLMNLPAYFDVLGQLGLLAWARLIALLVALAVGSALGIAAERTLRSYQMSRKYPRDYDDSEGYRDGDPRP